MIMSEAANNKVDPKEMGYWERLVEEYPNAGDTVQYDPNSPFDELRCHNTILHLLLLGFYSVPNQAEVARLLLDNGASPNLQNDKGETPLHLVCQGTMRDPEIATLLLTKGANHNVRTNDDKRPIDYLGEHDRYSREIRAMLEQNTA